MAAAGGAEMSLVAIEAAIMEEVGLGESPPEQAAPELQGEVAEATATTTEADLDVGSGDARMGVPATGEEAEATGNEAGGGRNSG